MVNPYFRNFARIIFPLYWAPLQMNNIQVNRCSLFKGQRQGGPNPKFKCTGKTCFLLIKKMLSTHQPLPACLPHRSTYPYWSTQESLHIERAGRICTKPLYPFLFRKGTRPYNMKTHIMRPSMPIMLDFPTMNCTH